MRRLLAALVLVLAAGAAEAQVTPRTQVQVDADRLRLVDLFDNLPANVRPDTEVARAPAPGQRMNVDTALLQAIARNHGLDWSPAGKFDRVVVERSADVVAADALRPLIGRGLVDRGLAPGSDFVLDNEQVRILVPTGRGGDVRLEGVTYEPSQPRFQATVIVPKGEALTDRVRVSGRVFATVSVAVPARPIQTGELIRARDVQVIRVRQDHIGPSHVTEPQQLLGRTARRALGAGQAVRASDLAAPTLVQKNAIVTVKVSAGRVQLAMQAKALDDGIEGETIRIQNTRSNKIIQGVVSGAGEVLVTPHFANALASN